MTAPAPLVTLDRPRDGVAMTKEVLWANVDAPSPEAAIHLENRTQTLAATGGEIIEAVTAFLEGRRPDWSSAAGLAPPGSTTPRT